MASLKGKQTEKKLLWLQASPLPKKEENLNYIEQQAGAELGQAQLKLEFDLTLIFFWFGLIELTGWYSCS